MDLEKRDFKILVVDDDDIVREVINSLLSREGYAVVSAQDGIEGINILKTEEVNLVITDLRMPGADGIEVLKYAVRNYPDTAVAILTALGTLDIALETIKEGAYDFLTKPFKVQEVVILAERAYKRLLLIKDNGELKKHLRETYCDMELIKTVTRSGNNGMITGWIERIERLKSMSILTDRETEILKERLVTEDGRRKDPNSG